MPVLLMVLMSLVSPDVMRLAEQPASQAIADPSGQDEAQRTLDTIVLTAIERWKDEATALDSAVSGICAAAPGNLPTAKTKARAAWVASMKAWRAAAILPIRPWFSGQFAYSIDWPVVNAGLLSRSIDLFVPPPGTPTLSGHAPLLERSSVEVRGMNTLAYLLWQESASNALSLEQTRTCSYAKLLAADLVQRADRLFHASRSAPGAQGMRTNSKGASSTEILLNAIVDGTRQLHKRYAALSQGVLPQRMVSTSDRFVELDGSRSNRSKELLVASVDQLSRALLGDEKLGVPGFVALLENGQSPDLPGKLRMLMETLNADASRFPPGLSEDNAEHRALAKQFTDDAQSLLNQLTGPVAVAAGVLVGFGDGDGG